MHHNHMKYYSELHLAIWRRNHDLRPYLQLRYIVHLITLFRSMKYHIEKTCMRGRTSQAQHRMEGSSNNSVVSVYIVCEKPGSRQYGLLMSHLIFCTLENNGAKNTKRGQPVVEVLHAGGSRMSQSHPSVVGP